MLAAAEPREEDVLGLVDRPGLQRVVYQLFQQVQRVLVLGQPDPGPLCQRREVLLHRLVDRHRVAEQPVEVVAYRRMDRVPFALVGVCQVAVHQHLDRACDLRVVSGRQPPRDRLLAGAHENAGERFAIYTEAEHAQAFQQLQL